MLVGTAGCWFLFDYAYYGNTLSLPSILSEVSPNASIELKLFLTLALFVIFALPGYVLAVWKMDKIGHRRLQFIGFGVMAGCFVLLGAVPALTTTVAPFIAIFGVSYLFTEFGPNMTTFVLPRRSSRSTCARRTRRGRRSRETRCVRRCVLGAPTRRPYWTRGLLYVAGVPQYWAFAHQRPPETAGDHSKRFLVRAITYHAGSRSGASAVALRRLGNDRGTVAQDSMTPGTNFSHSTASQVLAFRGELEERKRRAWRRINRRAGDQEHTELPDGVTTPSLERPIGLPAFFDTCI